MRVVILANDIVPGMGLPVAAPGLRAWGMAEGLRGLGHQVTVVVDPWRIGTVWDRALPAPLPRGTVVVRPRRVAEYVRTHGADALIICNSNHAEVLGDLGDCRLVYDFFAPKMLEQAENVARADLEQALANLERRKLAALARSHAVAINGAKKIPYVSDWLQRAGVPDLPTAVVNPALPAVTPRPRADGPLRVIVAGYLQPWSKPGAWAAAVVPLLNEGVMTLDLLVARHWGERHVKTPMPAELERLIQHPASTHHNALRFTDFRELLSVCDLSIDVFARNPERELAMVTRSVVALSVGLPVMHVPFTEVSPWIEQHGAGWLVDDDDPDAMTDILREMAADRAALAKARAGAVEVARTVLDPVVANRPLHDLLEQIV